MPTSMSARKYMDKAGVKLNDTSATTKSTMLDVNRINSVAASTLPNIAIIIDDKNNPDHVRPPATES